MQDLIEKFSLEHLNPSPAAINFTKLDYFNGLHIRNLSRDDLAHRLAPFIINAGYSFDKECLYRAIPIIRERLVTLDDVIPVAGFFFRDDVSPDPDRLVAEGLTPAESANIARQAYQILASLPQVSKELAEPSLRNFVEESGLKVGQVFGLLREAVTGQKASPPLFESMEIIGKDKVLQRIQSAIDTLDRM
jgi:glutamyl-tRNA synthetase